MTAPRFLIAKYVPDLRRMEPKNIGVIVWSNGTVRAKFVGEVRNGEPHVAPPAYLHVESRNAYRQWIEYWRAVIEKDSLQKDDGTIVDRNNPEFIAAIQAKSKQQYLLASGGEFLTKIGAGEIDI